MDLSDLSQRIRTLTCYRSLLETAVLRGAVELLRALAAGESAAAGEEWGELVYQLRMAQAEDLGSWLWEELRFADGPWVRLGQPQPPEALRAAAQRDVELLRALACLDRETLLQGRESALFDDLPDWSGTCPFSFSTLMDWYAAHGAGPFARYRAFRWEGGALLPIPEPDAPDPEGLVGYRVQRGQVEENTRALLAGRRVNNVLLFGQSGTGKSATVKSLLRLPDSEDLRLIEIGRDGVGRMPELLRSLSGRRQKFILFLDDLAFDQDDENYSVLKTILEGGLEPRPRNVAVYATSNRRSLVRQTISSREGDEIDRAETIQEKTALADRFGLRIPYLSLAMDEYLALVRRLAEEAGVSLPADELTARAVRWDVRHPGRSPRTAQQFIASLYL